MRGAAARAWGIWKGEAGRSGVAEYLEAHVSLDILHDPDEFRNAGADVVFLDECVVVNLQDVRIGALGEQLDGLLVARLLFQLLQNDFFHDGRFFGRSVHHDLYFAVLLVSDALHLLIILQDGFHLLLFTTS